MQWELVHYYKSRPPRLAKSSLIDDLPVFVVQASDMAETLIAPRKVLFPPLRPLRSIEGFGEDQVDAHAVEFDAVPLPHHGVGFCPEGCSCGVLEVVDCDADVSSLTAKLVRAIPAGQELGWEVVEA